MDDWTLGDIAEALSRLESKMDQIADEISGQLVTEAAKSASILSNDLADYIIIRLSLALPRRSARLHEPMVVCQ